MAIRISQSLVTCIAPPGASGAVAVDVVTEEGQAGAVNAVSFLYGPAAVLLRVVPSQGADSGGGVVTCVGANFAPSQELLCG